MGRRHSLRWSWKRNPNDQGYKYATEYNQTPTKIKLDLIKIHAYACSLETILEKKNGIILAKHKEIQRLNRCLYRRFFTIKKLKMLLKEFEEWTKQ